MPVGAQPASHVSSALATSPIVVKWFLLSVHGYKASLQLVFSWFSGCFFYHLVVIADWSWKEVSVASTYSSAMLDLYFKRF